MCQGCDKTDNELHEMHQCGCEECCCEVLIDPQMELMKFVCLECVVLNPRAEKTDKAVTAACVFTTHATEGNDVHLVEEGICLMSGNQTAYWQRCSHA